MGQLLWAWQVPKPCAVRKPEDELRNRGAVPGIGVTCCFARLGREADAGWSCRSVQEASRLLCVEDRERAGETTNKRV